VGVVVSVGLAFAGLDAEALVLGSIAGSVASTAGLYAVVRTPWPVPRLSPMREIARFGIPAALAGLSWTGFRNADFAIVGARLGTTGVGYYWRSYQFAIEYQRKVGSAVHQIAFPVYSRTNDLREMFALRQRVVRVTAAVLVPGLAALAVLAPHLVPWLLGSEWDPAIVPIQIMALAGIATVLSDTMGAVVLAAGRARAWLAFHLGCFAVYAPTVYLAAGHGVVAVCWAVVAVQVLGTVVSYGGLLHGLVERPLLRLWEDIAPGAAAAVGLVVVAEPATLALEHWDVAAPLLIAMAGAGGAVGAAVALRLASPDTWYDLTRMAGRMLPQRRRRRVAVSVPA
jgi:PST family polysaccharide transporter